MGEPIPGVNARGVEITFHEVGEGLIQMDVETDPGYSPIVKPMAVSGSEVWIKVGRKRVHPSAGKLKS